MFHKKILSNIFLLFIISTSLLYPMDKKQQKEASAASVWATDKSITEKIKKLLKQHNDAITSFSFPRRNTHTKFNNELPIIFNELKALYAQLSAEGKLRLNDSSDISLFTPFLNTCRCISGIQRHLNPEYDRIRAQNEMYNLTFQLNLQSSMLQWFYEGLNTEQKGLCKSHLEQVNLLVAQLKQEIPGATVVAKSLAIQNLNQKNATKNPTYFLDFAKIELQDPTDTNPPNLAFNPQTQLVVPEEVQYGLVQGQEHTQRVVDYFKAKSTSIACSK